MEEGRRCPRLGWLGGGGLVVWAVGVSGGERSWYLVAEGRFQVPGRKWFRGRRQSRVRHQAGGERWWARRAGVGAGARAGVEQQWVEGSCGPGRYYIT